MGSQITTIWNQQLVEALEFDPIAPGEIITALNSGDLNNSIAPIYNSIKVTINYDELNPDASGATFFIGCVIEFKDGNSNYHNLMYQFNSFNRSFSGAERILIMQPDIDTFNLGVDDIIFPVDRALARISRTQGELPPGVFRIRFLLQDNDPAGGKPFVSVKISTQVEKYNV